MCYCASNKSLDFVSCLICTLDLESYFHTFPTISVVVSGVAACRFVLLQDIQFN